MRILLLEDERSLRESIAEFLDEIGFSVDSFCDGESAYYAIFDKAYDILLLDVKTPKMNGFEILEAIKKEEIHIPTIFVTSMTHINDLQKGYEQGCCDYIRKPFELKELEFRIRQAIKANYKSLEKSKLNLPHGFVYDAMRFTLCNNDEEILLTKIEKNILELLIKNIGKVVGIEEFQHYVWGDCVEPTNIRMQIQKLRKKLSKDLIKNIRGHGYTIER